ncbi:hypothetical protein DFH06DRAFT_1340272 [Mycena polygramma]|nr:hypothetical protein DFH06DRAFT_1340272 [Mycena polygramma]
MSDRFAFNRECCCELLAYSNFRECVALSHSSRLFRSCANEIFGRRVVARVSRYLCLPASTCVERATRTARLFKLLGGEDGCIVGSVVQGLLCFTAADEGAYGRDLNILVNERNFASCLRLLHNDFSMTRYRMDAELRKEHRGLISSVYCFGRGPDDALVTVSCTVSSSVLPTLLSSRTTSQMNALSRTWLISCYPHMTQRRMGLLAWAAVAGSMLEYENFVGYRANPLQTRLDVDTGKDERNGGVQVVGWDVASALRDGQDVVENRSLSTAMYLSIPSEVELRFIESAVYTDLVSYAHVCAQARGVVQLLLSLRCATLLLRYIEHEDVDGFWRVLTIGKGGISGSAVVWIAQVSPDWQPEDLNTVVARGLSAETRQFLADRGWSQRRVESRIPFVFPVRPPLRPIAAYERDQLGCPTTWAFAKPGRPEITLTETFEETVFAHIARAKHSMATTLLTRTTIIALHGFEFAGSYSTWREKAFGCATDPGRVAGRVAAMGGQTNYFAGVRSPCGDRCPGLLRRMRGGRGVGLFTWRRPGQTVADVDEQGVHEESGPLDIVREDAYAGFMQSCYSFGWTWCICRNPACDTFMFPRGLSPSAPKWERLSTNPKENRILRTVRALEDSVPPFPLLAQFAGVLFPTSCIAPCIVPVPLDHGLKDFRTIDDLRTYTWITTRDSALPAWPDYMPPHAIVGSTTVFGPLSWREQYAPGRFLTAYMESTKNVGLVNGLFGRGELASPVYGDVLLMLESDGIIENVVLADAPRLVELFLTIRESKLSTGLDCAIGVATLGVGERSDDGEFEV